MRVCTLICYELFCCDSSVDLLRIVYQNLEINDMAKRVIASEPLLNASNFNVVKDAM